MPARRFQSAPRGSHEDVDCNATASWFEAWIGLHVVMAVFGLLNAFG